MSGDRFRPSITILGVVAALGAAAACAQEADSNPLTTATGGGPSQLPGEEPETPQGVHDVIEAAINDIEVYWRETFPEVYGAEFETLQGGYYPYGPDTPDSEMPPCGEPAPRYDEIAENAFYCTQGDLIAWDEVNLMPQLARDFGPFTVGIVLAHEYGHAIQPRADVPFELPTIVLENQADCFAGAWTAWIAEGNSESFSVEESTLDAAVAGLVSFADAPGAAAADPMAHGAAFDRVGAFQEGFEQGAARCATYADEPPPTVEIPFSGEELTTGGNMPIEDLLPSVETNLNTYYDLLFQDLGQTWAPVEDLIVASSGDEVTCDGESLSGDELELASLYCEQENVVVLDGEQLVPQLYDDIGDFAVGAEIGRLYSRAAQLQLGIEEENRDTSLQADCLTGVWAAENFPDPETDSSDLIDRAGAEAAGDIMLSAGDLDEAIVGFLAYGEALEEEIGTAFERTDALRAGFLEGVDACEEYAPVGG